MSKETELKPCPFCGEEMNGKWHKDTHGLYCEECMEDSVYVETWNNRPIEDALREEIAEAKTDAYTLSDTLAQANAEIERLKAPHPTCETCGRKFCERLRVVNSGWAYNSTAQICYCSAHTALKKDGE